MELAAQGPGNRLAEGGLAHPRRADKAENRALGGLVQFTDRQVFQDPLLDLVQPVMVGIQDLLGDLQIEPVAAAFAPRHLYEPIQIGPDDAGLRGIGVHHLQTLELLFCLLPGMGGHPGLDYLDAQLFNLLGPLIHVAQFFFQGLQLFPQVVFTLRTAHLLLGLGLDLGLHGGDFQFLVQVFGHQIQAFHRVKGFQHRLRLRDLEPQVGAHQIGQAARLLNVIHDHHQVGGKNAAQRHDLFSLLAHRAHDRLYLHGDLFGLMFLNHLRLNLKKRLFLDELLYLYFGQGLDQDLEASVGQLQGPHDHAHHAHIIEFFRFGIFLGGIALGQEYQELILGQCFIYRCH